MRIKVKAELQGKESFKKDGNTKYTPEIIVSSVKYPANFHEYNIQLNVTADGPFDINAEELIRAIKAVMAGYK